jgi:hypothetical protein
VVLSQGNVITVDGLPVHPLLVHGVVVLLPLAALGGLVIAARGAWRRRFGMLVLVLTAAGVALVPLATTTGRQLKGGLPDNPLIDRHEQLGNTLLPYALAFGVSVLLLVIAGRLADRERTADGRVSPDNGGLAGDSTAAGGAAAGGTAAGGTAVGRTAVGGTAAGGAAVGGAGRGGMVDDDAGDDGSGADGVGGAGITRTWRRTAAAAAVLVALTGTATTVQLVRVGHSGSVAVWKGVGVR